MNPAYLFSLLSLGTFMSVRGCRNSTSSPKVSDSRSLSVRRWTPGSHSFPQPCISNVIRLVKYETEGRVRRRVQPNRTDPETRRILPPVLRVSGGGVGVGILIVLILISTAAVTVAMSPRSRSDGASLVVTGVCDE